jgi:hypothetical protein
MKRSFLLCSVLLLAIALVQPVYAADDFEGPWERFSVSLGGFGALSSSDVRIGTNVLGAGIDIDVEELLGVSTSQASARLEALYRIGEKRRHRVGLSYFAFRRSGNFIATKNIDEGDIQIDIGDTVDTVYNTDILKLDYAYSFFMDERFNLAVSGGFFVMPIEFEISASPGGETAQADITAPLPVVGFSFDYAISPKWMLKQTFELFYLEFGDFTGGITDTRFSVEWNVWEHWGFGAGLESFRMAVEATDADEDVPGVNFIGKINTSYIGLSLYARYRF